MEYKDIRKIFVEKSGRYDLVKQDWNDNGADFFLNAGQRFLDRQTDVQKDTAGNVQSIAAGTILVKTIGLRSLREVWAGNSTDGLVKLTKAPLSWLKEEYGEQISSVTQDDPLYYALVGLRPYPDATLAATWSGYYDIDDFVLGDTHYTYRGILLCPPPSKTWYIRINGTFYSPVLSAVFAAGVWTQTKSFWTECHEDILLQAALYKMEVFYRNTEGAKDWKGALDIDLLSVDKDQADEECVDINQMEG